MKKVSNIDVNSSDTRFTASFFGLAQKVLLSDNLKFPIDKINFLPAILYQAKYDCELVCNLSKNLFSYSLFEKAILPEMLKYFNALGSRQKELIELLSDYLINHKELITLNSSYLREALTVEALSEVESFYEMTVKEKGLAQFVKCLTEKKNDGKS